MQAFHQRLNQLSDYHQSSNTFYAIKDATLVAAQGGYQVPDSAGLS